MKVGRLSPTIMLAVILAISSPTEAGSYTLRQKAFRGADGRVSFACISKPFVGTVAYVPSPYYRSGLAAIVVPESGYAAFLRRRYPTSWYAAARTDIARGLWNTPAARAFDQATRKTATVMFEAEGSQYGNFDQPYSPISEAHTQYFYMVDSAISNCRISK